MLSKIASTKWWTKIGSWSYLDTTGEFMLSVRNEYREHVDGSAEIRRTTVGRGVDRLEVIRLQPGRWTAKIQCRPAGGWAGLGIEPDDETRAALLEEGRL